jgi:hypothetical protein
MKKQVVSAIMTGFILINCSAYAAQTIGIAKGATLKFSPTAWVSRGLDDLVTIQVSSPNLASSVLITVENMYPHTAGINLKNCGSITHAHAGSSVLCAIGTDISTPVTFSSDTAGVIAGGSLQIQ